MPSIKLNNAQQATALQLLQTLCAYPESSLSQEFQKLAHSLPTDGQADIHHWEQLTAFFQAQGVDMEDFADAAESLYESPGAWVGFADHCVYTLKTVAAGSAPAGNAVELSSNTSSPTGGGTQSTAFSSPGGKVVFNRASDTSNASKDGYTITYNAPDGSTTPLHYTNGRLVSGTEQANPAINLYASYAPNGPISEVPALQPALSGSVNGQQAIGLNLDEAGSDDETFWQKSIQFVTDHWIWFSIGSGVALLGGAIVLVVKYVRRVNSGRGQRRESGMKYTEDEIIIKLDKIDEEYKKKMLSHDDSYSDLPMRLGFQQSWYEKQLHKSEVMNGLLKQLSYEDIKIAIKKFAVAAIDQREFTLEENLWFEDHAISPIILEEFKETFKNAINREIKKQQDQISKLQSIQNTPETRELMFKNNQEQINLEQIDPQNPLLATKQLLEVQKSIIQTGAEVKATDANLGIQTDNTTRRIQTEQTQVKEETVDESKKQHETNHTINEEHVVK